MSFAMAARTRRMNASAIREILKMTERPGVLSMAGGLPSPQSFPIDALSRASAKVWSTKGVEAMQYASSEGLPALREWIARRLNRHAPWHVRPQQVLITTGSQQGLDLLGKVLIEPGCQLLVEQPSYLGALQAFSVFEPRFVPWQADGAGPMAASLQPGFHHEDDEARAAPRDGRMGAAYLIPNFQNPTGACLDAARRVAIARAADEACIALIEDDPYGDLWYDAPPPPPIAAHAPHRTVYLGSMSKTLAPGLRLGFIVTPPDDVPGASALRAKLLQAKQASDLHTPGFSQRLVMQLLADGFDMDAHVAGVRERYKHQRDAMAQALQAMLPRECVWRAPAGGMFFWVQGPEGFDAAGSLAAAVEGGVAYVPGAAFYSDEARAPRQALRLSFVTLSETQIHEAVSRLARHIGAAVNLAA